MAGMRRRVDTTKPEFLLRPLYSGALILKAFPDEAIGRICSPACQKNIFPLFIRAQQPDPESMKTWTTVTWLVTDDVSLTAEVADVILRQTPSCTVPLTACPPPQSFR